MNKCKDCHYQSKSSKEVVLALMIIVWLVLFSKKKIKEIVNMKSLWPYKSKRKWNCLLIKSKNIQEKLIWNSNNYPIYNKCRIIMMDCPLTIITKDGYGSYSLGLVWVTTFIKTIQNKSRFVKETTIIQWLLKKNKD
jgi:hypothetical protein